MIKKLAAWWKQLHICDDRVIDSDPGGCVFECRICKRIWLYRG